jgi:pyruvate formate lyase activating enzyme
MDEPFAQPLTGGALLCSFCPRRCRLSLSETGRCAALAYGPEGLRPTRPPGAFRLRTVAAPLSGLFAFSDLHTVLQVLTSGSGLSGRTSEPPPDVHFTPEQVVFVASAWQADGIHLATDDPVFDVSEGHEIVMRARAAGMKAALTTSGYLTPAVREILFDGLHTVNLRLWSMGQAFYGTRFGARVEPVLSTVEWLGAHPRANVEVTVPIVAGENDRPFELERLARWIARTLGASVPIHFEGPLLPQEAER